MLEVENNSPLFGVGEIYCGVSVVEKVVDGFGFAREGEIDHFEQIFDSFVFFFAVGGKTVVLQNGDDVAVSGRNFNVFGGHTVIDTAASCKTEGSCKNKNH